MDLQTWFDNTSKQMRDKSFAESPQLTLGEIIEKLERIHLNKDAMIEKYDHEARVEYDFGTAFPTTLDSWRGAYRELALGYELSEYDGEQFAHKTLTDLLEELKGAIGKTYTGWKGGDFVMDDSTPVWVANSGNAGNTAIVDIVDNEYSVILMTSYCEY